MNKPLCKTKLKTGWKWFKRRLLSVRMRSQRLSSKLMKKVLRQLRLRSLLRTSKRLLQVNRWKSWDEMLRTGDFKTKLSSSSIKSILSSWPEWVREQLWCKMMLTGLKMLASSKCLLKPPNTKNLHNSPWALKEVPFGIWTLLKMPLSPRTKTRRILQSSLTSRKRTGSQRMLTKLLTTSVTSVQGASRRPWSTHFWTT